MNRSIQEYLQRANQAANEAWVGADGQFDGFAGDPGAWFDATGGAAPAAPAASMNALPKSMPYIVVASNASAASVSTVLFNAATYLYGSNGTWNSDGSLTVNNVTISSGITNVNYRQLLSQSQASPFSIGGTLIQAIGGVAQQVNNPLTLSTQDANGMQASKVIPTPIDPYQNQSNSLFVSMPFQIDFFTGITFSLFANQVVQFYFYPADTINLARGLNGTPVSKQFADPRIIRPAQR